MQNFKIGILGAGNMSTAILNGILKGSILTAEDIIVSDIDKYKLKNIADKGIFTTFDNELLFKTSDFIILAVKPQVATNLLCNYKTVAKDKKIISIMAGITKNSIKNMLGDVFVTRIMPNTPCLIGEGMCAVDASDFNNEDKAFVLKIINNLGKTIELPEQAFDAVTALSGSGPAYVYTFIEAMIDAGIDFGLSKEESKILTIQTFKGAVSMAENALDIKKLIENVCSPGGTTIEAVNYYKENRLKEIITEGINKCEKRSEELSKNV